MEKTFIFHPDWFDMGPRARPGRSGSGWSVSAVHGRTAHVQPQGNKQLMALEQFTYQQLMAKSLNISLHIHWI